MMQFISSFARTLRRLIGGLILILIPIAMLAGIGWGVVYVRLMNGPVSLSYLKPTIEQQISEKLGGLSVAVSDVVLSLVDKRAEFRLTDVSVRDEAGKLVAQAPMASMEIDRIALFRGQITPTGIVLIRPQMQLSYSESDGLSLSFKRAGKVANEVVASNVVASNVEDGRSVPAAIAPVVVENSAQGAEPRPEGSPDGSGVVAGESITVLRSIASLLTTMRGDAVSGFSLDRIGVRNGLVEIDYDGRVTRWGVPSGDLDMRLQDDRSVISGLATISESQGQNIVLSFNAETAQASRQIVLRTSVRNLMPAALMRVAPNLRGLEAVTSAMSAEASFTMTDSGAVVAGDVTVEMGPGELDLAAVGGVGAVVLDSGRVALSFDDKSDVVAVKSSTVRWGRGNALQFSGEARPTAGTMPGASNGAGWAYKLRAERGQFIAQADDAPRPVKEWSVSGRVEPNGGRLVVDEGALSVAGARASFKGDMMFGGAGGYSVDGVFGRGPLAGLMYVWPTTLLPDVRHWARTHVTGGQMVGGTFRAGRQPDDAKGAGDPVSSELALRVDDLRLLTGVGDLEAFAPRVLLQAAGSAIEISAPDAVAQVLMHVEVKAGANAGKEQSLALKQLKFVVADGYGNNPIGQLSFKVNGSLRDGAGILRAAHGVLPLSDDVLKRLDTTVQGRVEGRIGFAIPLYVSDETQTGTTSVPEVTGKLAIRDVRMRDVFGRHDLSGGTFDVNLAAKSINANGEMLIAGVATKIAWQYILDAPFESQPPIRLRASLDELDRTKLGIQINHIVRGIVDVEANIIPLNGGGFGSKVGADMSKASITVESLAWVKPIGRRMQVEFDVVVGKSDPVALENIRAVGDGIAIQGRAALDAQHNLRAFEMPQFSIDRVTRLQINGKLDKANVWVVTVKGQTFEGRPLFRSLFLAGQVGAGPGGADKSVPDAEQMGVDLVANVTTVLGFWNSTLSNVQLSLSKRQGKIQSMQLEGQLEGGELFKAAILRGDGEGVGRELHAFSTDAGKAFALVGFYPNAQNGRLELVVNLDAKGRADQSGVLLVRKFRIRGDEVVGELSRAPRDGLRPRRARGTSTSNGAPALDFDWMRVPFFIGNGQFILQGAELRGPVVGATIEGKADFGARTLDLSGTYVPLQGLNGALGVIPGLGQILAGPNGEGVLGMKFAVRGAMSEPEMLVNPLSIMAPGIFREMFQASSPSLEVTNPSTFKEPPASGTTSAGRGGRKKNNWRNGAFEAN